MSLPNNNHKRRLMLVATLAAAAASALAVSACSSADAQSEPAAPAAPAATPVSVAQVIEREVTTWNEFSGRLEAVERVEVRSRVAGTVRAVHFREGALVRQGDLLVTIDPEPYAAEVDRADAQVVAARARLAYATSELQRAERLWEERAISQRELDERTHARRQAEADLRAAEAALQSAKLNLGYTQVRAPVAGRVGKLEVTVGNLVAAGPGAPVLTTLVSVSPIYAAFDADEEVVLRALKDLPPEAVARGRLERVPVRMTTALGTGEALQGHLQLVDNQVDARSGTVRVRAIFDNADGQLIPGQFVRLQMGQPKAVPAVLINERAVGTDQDKKFVLVVGEDRKVAYREITLGPVVDGLRVVTSGLKGGERIVVNGLQRVRPGSLVEPQMVAMDARGNAAQKTAATTPSKQS
ncbi:MAG TPA: efflux RND transporter periplasmic adaptor subunit [Burkholderiaceae bacterium]|nr:efflux RND transporter periplasmic adaptor subunit [Burkholderiaceae bacterium]